MVEYSGSFHNKLLTFQNLTCRYNRMTNSFLPTFQPCGERQLATSGNFMATPESTRPSGQALNIPPNTPEGCLDGIMLCFYW